MKNFKLAARKLQYENHFSSLDKIGLRFLDYSASNIHPYFFKIYKIKDRH